MAIRKIVTLPDPVLRKKSRPVKSFGTDLQTLIDDMVDTMREAPGVGLAAPQLGILQRVIVVEFGDEDDDTVPAKLFTVVNPEITRATDETDFGVEGCLSIPNVVGEVERPLAVTVKGLSRRGQKVKFKMEGWLARIFQHEIDHLNGVLFIDKATDVWKPEPTTPPPPTTD